MVVTSFQWNNYTNISLPTNLSRVAYGIYKNNLYLFGGKTGSGTVGHNTKRIYKGWTLDDTVYWDLLNITIPDDIDIACDGQCSVVVNDSIYIITPCTSNYQQNIVYKFNFTSQNWTNINNSLIHAVTCAACVTSNNTHIFVLGGDNINYNNNQIYSISEDKWYMYGNLSNDTSGLPWYFGSCVYHHNTQKIYLFGGQWAEASYSKSIHSYDIFTGKWTKSQSMLSVYRAGALAITYDDRMYIIGGFGGTQTTPRQYYTIVDIYDPEQDTITNGTELNHQRALAIGFINNSRIYVLGGEYQQNSADQKTYSYLKSCEMSMVLTSSNHLWFIVILALSIVLVIGFFIIIFTMLLKYYCHDKVNNDGKNSLIPAIIDDSDDETEERKETMWSETMEQSVAK